METAIKKINNYSNKQPIGQLVILILCTFGLYHIYWFYRNWKQLYPPNNVKVTPWLRTIGLFVPGVNIFLMWFQFIDIKNFANKHQVKSFQYPGWLTLGLCASISFSGKISVVLLGFLLNSLVLLLLTIPQATINRYWEKETPNLPEKTKLSKFEILICCLSIILYCLLAYIYIWHNNQLI